MGLACLVFPGANHTRYEHSIGSMYVADRLAGALVEKTENEFVKSKIQETRLAALLHDVGHAPFSHVTEEFFRRNPDCLPAAGKNYDHEMYTKTIIRRNDEIKAICKKYKIDYKFVSDLAIGKSKSFLDGLLSSAVDVDKIDYVARDSYFCGLPYGSIDLTSLEEGITLTHNSFGNEVIAFDSKNKDAVERLITSRYYLTSSIHVDPKNCAAIQLLLRALRSAYNALFKAAANPEQADEIKNLILDCLHFQWVDHDLITFLDDPFQKLQYAAIEANREGFSSLDYDSLEAIIRMTSTHTRRKDKWYISHFLLKKVLQGRIPDLCHSSCLVNLSTSARYSLYVLHYVSPYTGIINSFKEIIQTLKPCKGKSIFVDVTMPKPVEMNTRIVVGNGNVKYLFDLSLLMRSLSSESTNRLTISIYSAKEMEQIPVDALERYINLFCRMARRRAIKEGKVIGSDLILLIFYFLHQQRLFFEGDTRFQALFSVLFGRILDRSQIPYKELRHLPKHFGNLSDVEIYERFRKEGYPDFFSVKFSQDLDLLSDMGMVYTRSEPVRMSVGGQYPRRYERRISRPGREYVDANLLGDYPFCNALKKGIDKLQASESCLIKLGT